MTPEIPARAMAVPETAVPETAARGMVAAVMVAVRNKCVEDEGPVLKHWIDRIDIRNGQAEALANDEGGAHAVFGRDGALYLQVEDPSGAHYQRTIRYATPGAASFETLPEGVLLVPQLLKPTCE